MHALKNLFCITVQTNVITQKRGCQSLPAPPAGPPSAYSAHIPLLRSVFGEDLKQQAAVKLSVSGWIALALTCCPASVYSFTPARVAWSL